MGDSEDLRRVSPWINTLIYHSILEPQVISYFSPYLQLSLADIQTNSSIANILPDLAQYIDETVSGRPWHEYQYSQAHKLLVVTNSH